MRTEFETIADRVRSHFPAYYVKVEEIPDSPRTRAIAVYGVPSEEVKSVRDFIKDLDWELSGRSDCVVVARVVNRETTTAYYPEYMALLADCLYSVLRSFRQPLLTADIWSLPQLPQRRAPAVPCAANEELALAA